jgi:hypothetical protein
MGRRIRSGREERSARYRVALFAGAVSGGLWVLLVDTLLDAAGPWTLPLPLMAGAWAGTGLGVAALLARPGGLRELWGRAAIAVGLHALALPVAVAVSLVVAGARWSASDPGSLELTAVVMGVRLAATSTAIRVGVAGFVLGLLLLSVGDRALRARRRSRILIHPRR